jgi:hypothetical protein
MRLERVTVRVTADYDGEPAVSTPIEVAVEVEASASEEEIAELVAHVDRIAEIPNSLRRGTAVRIGLGAR